MAASTLRPLIAICGTTGVGKSKLAIELALHLNQSSSKSGGWQGARIINADSMQVYAGLDIITNKVTKAEMQGVEHLLMGFKSPGEQYVVGQWVQDALKLIDETHARNQIPIIVGGTSYWIQHLMFPNRLAYETPSQDATPTEAPPASRPDDQLQETLGSLAPNLRELYDNLPTSPPNADDQPDIAFKMHTLLSKLDPPVGSRWHWKDTRKVLRSLQIIHESGRRVSEIIQEQTADTPLPRFRTLCFWLFAEPPVLEQRLNERCDTMIEQGLLDEVQTLQKIAKSSTAIPVPLTPEEVLSNSAVQTGQPKVDYTLGIYQSIGYREFNEFLATNGNTTSKAFFDALERMKISTRQYAKRQITWIRNKLLPAMYAANTQADGDIAPAYLLDATELGDQWVENVQKPGIEVTEAFLAQEALPDPSGLSVVARRMLAIEQKAIDPTSVLNARQKITCEICTTNPERPFMIEEGREWEVHRKTRLHRRLAAAQARKLNPQPRHPKDKRVQREETSDLDVDASSIFT